MDADDQEVEKSDNGLPSQAAKRQRFYELVDLIAQVPLNSCDVGTTELLSPDEVIGLMLTLSRPEAEP